MKCASSGAEITEIVGEVQFRKHTLWMVSFMQSPDCQGRGGSARHPLRRLIHECHRSIYIFVVIRPTASKHGPPFIYRFCAG